jgi:phosphoribosylformylglycinamidine synthase
LFDEKYIGNPVVYCGTVGLIPKDRCKKRITPGDLIVLIGGRTGRDGIHGVTFASTELTEESEITSSQAVQIGNPITEKKVTDVLLQMRDKKLYHAITDCGGGGLSSAVGELARPYGARVNLEKVPLKYEGLSYWEIWISEAQERMILFVPPKNIDKVIEMCKEEDVEVTVIGEIIKKPSLLLYYCGVKVGELDMEFLHTGIPLSPKIAEWKEPNFPEDSFTEPKDLTPYLLKILASPNVCSKEWIIRQYDHEVQGGSVIKPIVAQDGPSDASVVRPLLNSKYGIVVSCGINPKYGKIDPYWMAASAVDEAIRNVVAVGGDPHKIALLDNFSWGNPNKKEVLGELVRAVNGCCMVAKEYKTPFISGKDSLNNEYRVGNQLISIPPTLLISAIGVISDVEKTITMDLKGIGNSIYLLGSTFNELGGSHYYEILNAKSKFVPKVRPNFKLFTSLHQAIKKGLVCACHDCSEGGIGVACAEMCFASNVGMEVWLNKIKCGDPIERSDWILFSESNSRFIVEVPKEKEKEFEKIMQSCEIQKIGVTTGSPELKVFGLNGKLVVNASSEELKRAWRTGLSEKVSKEKDLKTVSKKEAPSYQLPITDHRARVLILRTGGTNCDMETQYAFELVGAKVDLVHINQLIRDKRKLQNYSVLVFPGGFTYGDDISAGKILANEIKFRLQEEIDRFVEGGRLVLGICNGFQVLTKLGLLPWGKIGEQVVTLTNNVSGAFQCEWVNLKVEESPCVFTQGMEDFELPIAHAEGRFVADKEIISKLFMNKQVVIRYKNYNPNGSIEGIAGICDPSGRIFGLMPHPERFIFKTQHPQWTSEECYPQGLLIFKNIIKSCISS